MELAERTGDRRILLTAHHARGIVAWYEGRPADAAAAFGAVVPLAEELHGQPRSPLLEDPEVTSRGYLALATWLLGDHERAIRLRPPSRSAPAGTDPRTRLRALWLAALLGLFTRDLGAVRSWAADAIELGRRHGLSRFESLFTVLDGRDAALQGEPVQADRIRVALDGQAAAGTRSMRHMLLALRTEAELAEGRTDDARAGVAEAEADVRVTGESYFAGELRRIADRLARGIRSPEPSTPSRDRGSVGHVATLTTPVPLRRPYPPQMSDQNVPDPDVTEPDVAQEDSERTFDRLVDEGEQRLGRSWPGLLATGTVGGLDIGIGVLALLLVEHATGSLLLGGLAFSIGFIALTLARSELFTEDFLVPVAAIVAKSSPPLALLRLWGVTILTNLAGGWVITWIIIAGFPSVHSTALKSADSYIGLGITWRAFALALVGGFLITLMTHMQHSTNSDGVRLVPATVMGFLLGAGQVNHAIVASLLCFAALHVGAPFGYADWLGLLAFAALGNLIGGLGLVTVLRLFQVPDKVARSRSGA